LDSRWDPSLRFVSYCYFHFHLRSLVGLILIQKQVVEEVELVSKVGVVVERRKKTQ
jgi:hypothetical protein